MKEIIQFDKENQAFVDWDYIGSLTDKKFVSEFKIHFDPKYASSFCICEDDKFLEFYITENKLGSIFYALYNKQDHRTIEIHSIHRHKVKFYLEKFPNLIS
ncbi:hypothetical protein [Brevibacillus sp. SYSU BS000544]|uniref:hypothetical protein n=1 Tax=Brevibacillus sp. SYSU BS000544 TaxID=3416443 RepID=UPI003CE58FE9